MKKLPCVLVLSGLDPGAGAGLLADVRAIHKAGAFACGVVTVQTVQSTRGLARALPVSPRVWVAQARTVLDAQRVRAIKIGALGMAANVRAAAALLRAHPKIPVVVDPVLVPTRGRGRLLDARALRALRDELVPRATLVTANVSEAEALTGSRVRTIVDAYLAAKAIVALGAKAALVKGGHLEGPRSKDVLVVGRHASTLSAPRLRLAKPIHGAGCVLASLITGRLALGHDVAAATRWAKRVHARAFANAADVGGPLAVLSMDA